MVDYACTQKKKDVPKVLAQQEVRLQTDDGRKMKDLEQQQQQLLLLLGTQPKTRSTVCTNNNNII